MTGVITMTHPMKLSQKNRDLINQDRSIAKSKIHSSRLHACCFTRINLGILGPSAVRSHLRSGYRQVAQLAIETPGGILTLATNAKSRLKQAVCLINDIWLTHIFIPDPAFRFYPSPTPPPRGLGPVVIAQETVRVS